MKRIILLVPLCVFLFTACVPVRYSEYTGKDSSSYLGTWPVASGTMAETSYTIPVYRGWPERPYQVLGSVSIADPNKNWMQDEGVISAAAHEAKSHGANAIVIRAGAELGVFAIAESTDKAMVGYSYQTTALAIRWLTPQEIADRQKIISDFINQLHFANQLYQPSGNRSVAELVITFLVRSGVELKSPDLFSQFEEVMKKLTSATPSDLNGEWVFKATVSTSSDLGADDKKTEIGIAKVSCDGQSINIVSSEGTDEMNFTGTLSKGGLVGQIGVGQISSKCAGVAMDDKISINFQSLTRDSTLRGNVALQRLILKPNNTNNEKDNTNPSAHRL